MSTKMDEDDWALTLAVFSPLAPVGDEGVNMTELDVSACAKVLISLYC